MNLDDYSVKDHALLNEKAAFYRDDYTKRDVFRFRAERECSIEEKERFLNRCTCDAIAKLKAFQKEFETAVENGIISSEQTAKVRYMVSEESLQQWWAHRSENPYNRHSLAFPSNIHIDIHTDATIGAYFLGEFHLIDGLSVSYTYNGISAFDIRHSADKDTQKFPKYALYEDAFIEESFAKLLRLLCRTEEEHFVKVDPLQIAMTTILQHKEINLVSVLTDITNFRGIGVVGRGLRFNSINGESSGKQLTLREAETVLQSIANLERFAAEERERLEKNLRDIEK